MHLLGIAMMLALPWAARADSPTIYVSYDGNGTPHYSSQAYDGSYTVFLPGETDKPAAPAAAGKPRRPGAQPEAVEPLIQAAARRHGLEPALLRAVIETESGFDHEAVSPRGAIGLMQVLPATARRYGITGLKDPARNIEAGAHYLRDLLARFDANLPLSLAAYNAGEGAVIRHSRRIPPYRETLLYVPTVLTAYAAGRQAEGGGAPPPPARDRQEAAPPEEDDGHGL